MPLVGTSPAIRVAAAGGGALLSARWNNASASLPMTLNTPLTLTYDTPDYDDIGLSMSSGVITFDSSTAGTYMVFGYVETRGTVPAASAASFTLLLIANNSDPNDLIGVNNTGYCANPTASSANMSVDLVAWSVDKYSSGDTVKLMALAEGIGSLTTSMAAGYSCLVLVKIA